jgi:Ca-activated chloride channel family protein
MFLVTSIAVALAWIGAAGVQSVDGPQVTLVPRAHAYRQTRPNTSIRVDANLVLVPVTVTDVRGAPFRGLTRDAFQIFENGIERRLKYFTAEDAPISLGIVFDASGSMQGKLDQSRAAVADLFWTVIPGDEFFAVEVSDSPKLLCDLTDDPQRIEQSLAGISARSTTALLDSIYLAIQHLKHARNSRRALLILSDGGENSSRYTRGEIYSLVREADVCIYSVALSRWIRLSLDDVSLLKRLSEETGGRFWQVANVNDLPETMWKVSAAIRDLYVLYFSPGRSSNDGLYRKIKVRLRPTPGLPLHVAWRKGYFAPARAITAPE